jgi:hypothetical protein
MVKAQDFFQAFARLPFIPGAGYGAERGGRVKGGGVASAAGFGPSAQFVLIAATVPGGGCYCLTGL